MVHGITQNIAFCYVLHRCESRDIHYRESFYIFCDKRTTSLKTSPFFISIHWCDSRQRFVCFASKRLILTSHPSPMGKGTTRPIASRLEGGKRSGCTRTTSSVVYNTFTGRSTRQVSTMILLQVHLRKPCYDFFL
ncbi:hypothetical protein J1N35_022770 [Gossypium stocksii]|uniref:Uncharacterized protein n=1 Tax=Gossypium stocksii TaxID=47602 RepID=A0A9D3VII7_9ROSI|nr:hypothetical protein J1N35_022770 [Gossypium stocksii]